MSRGMPCSLLLATPAPTSTRPFQVRQISPIADPLRRNDRELLRQLIQGRGVARSEAGELFPGVFRPVASVAGLSQSVAGLVEFAALDNGIVEPTVVEIPGQVFNEMIADFGHQMRCTFGFVL